jgi:hypothetical protein
MITSDNSQRGEKLYKTDNNGAYTIGKLPDGVYTLLFHKDGYLSVFYGNTFVWEDASVIDLTGNSHVTGITTNLKKMESFGGQIAGKTYGLPIPSSTLSGTLVSAQNSSGQVVATAISEYDGNYLVPSLGSSSYTIKASRVGYMTSEYSQQVQINLSTSPVVEGINITLPQSPSSIKRDEGMPDNFQLFQNYPNPFNPVTKIKFSISGNSNVRLAVYDILGKEIATLVDEFLSQGNYSIEFKAENLPSGFYIYQLTAGTFSEVKKMILLK